MFEMRVYKKKKPDMIRLFRKENAARTNADFSQTSYPIRQDVPWNMR